MLLDTMSKAVFLDKDGTLVEDVSYNVDPQHIRLVDGAVEGLRLLQQGGFRFIVITNQSGVARGYFDEHELAHVEGKVRDLLMNAGIRLAGFYYCPHHPQGEVAKYAVECFCRKPRPGLLYQASFDHHIDLSSSWMVGDILDDVEAGNRAGCRTVLVNEGEPAEDMLLTRKPSFMATDLYKAAQIIAAESFMEWNLNHDEKQF